MKKIFILVCLILMIGLFLVGCNETGRVEDVRNEDYSQGTDFENKPTTKSQEDIKEEKGILIDTLTLGEDEQFKGKITKNKLTKVANIDFSYYINDTDEKADFLGSEVYMAPMLINMLCKIFPMGFYDPESLEDLVNNLNEAINEFNEGESEETEAKKTEDNKILNKLEGYNINNVILVFYDKETNEKIAECSSKGKDDLNFKTYRDYDPENSFMGVEIGK